MRFDLRHGWPAHCFAGLFHASLSACMRQDNRKGEELRAARRESFSLAQSVMIRFSSITFAIIFAASRRPIAMRAEFAAFLDFGLLLAAHFGRAAFSNFATLMILSAHYYYYLICAFSYICRTRCRASCLTRISSLRELTLRLLLGGTWAAASLLRVDDDYVM